MNFFDALASIDRAGFVEKGKKALENLTLMGKRIDELSISEDEKKSINITIQQFSDIVAVFQQIDLVQISDALTNLPQDVQRSAEKWAEYGWVPYLPTSNLKDLFQMKYPQSQEEADQIMLEQLDNRNIKTLFESLADKVRDHTHNMTTFDEAVKSFQAEIWSGCALLLFAIIDSCFVVGQPKKGKLERALANQAVDNAINQEKSARAVFAYTARLVIKRIYARGKDFKPSIEEKGINRNFLSHGMNAYIPTREDCLRLFVLLYNVYVSFDGGFFRWEIKDTESNSLN